VFAQGEGEEEPAEPTGTFDHTAWNGIASTYVTEQGRFDYTGLAASTEDLDALDAYLGAVAEASLSDLSEAEKLAFWINAYNANTVKGVLDNRPLDSVMNAEGFFDSVTIRVAGLDLTLNDLENERIRAVFQEPRIHFAVNCASLGCPPLRPAAFTGAMLEQQLEEQAHAFVRSTSQYRANEMEVHLSRIFEWFGGDFDATGGVRAFVASHLDDDEAAAVRIEANVLVFTDYDWQLNSP
jgi:hypothetical protein